MMGRLRHHYAIPRSLTDLPEDVNTGRQHGLRLDELQDNVVSVG